MTQDTGYKSCDTVLARAALFTRSYEVITRTGLPSMKPRMSSTTPAK